MDKEFVNIPKGIYHKSSKIKKDISGQKFGKLTVLEYYGHLTSKRSRQGSYWICQCECGNKTVQKGPNLIHNKVYSCGCQNKIKPCGSKNKKWIGKNGIRSEFVQRCKQRAKRFEMDFDLDLDFICELYEKQNKKCALTGMPINFCESKVLDSGNNKTTVSIDRINSKRGYTKDNVQLVHVDINWMKQSLSQEEFIEMCSKVFQYSINGI